MLIAGPAVNPARGGRMQDHAQDEYRRLGVAAQRRAHHALCRQGARPISPSAASTSTSSSSRAAQSPAAKAAAAQGTALVAVTPVAIGRGVKVRQIWGLAPRLPQSYMVTADIKTAKDLKGKKLSAVGGGVGGFNWLHGPRSAQIRRPQARRRAVHRRRRPPDACRAWSPGRSTASRCIRKRLPGAQEQPRPARAGRSSPI